LRLPKRVVVNGESTVQLPKNEKVVLQLLLAQKSNDPRPIDIGILAIISTHGLISFRADLLDLLFALFQGIQHTLTII
jgi:hypothetical protein